MVTTSRLAFNAGIHSAVRQELGRQPSYSLAMVSQPQVVAEAILTALAAAPRKEELRAGR